MIGNYLIFTESNEQYAMSKRQLIISNTAIQQYNNTAIQQYSNMTIQQSTLVKLLVTDTSYFTNFIPFPGPEATVREFHCYWQ